MYITSIPIRIFWLAIILLTPACRPLAAGASTSNVPSPTTAAPVIPTANISTPAVSTGFAVSTAVAISTGVPSMVTTALAGDGSPTQSVLTSPQKITLQDNRGQVLLQPGDRFLLDLDENYDWTVQVADPAIVERVIGIAVIRGAQGVYQALASGQTTLNAIGDPPCLKSQPPCLIPSISFEVTVNVQ